MFFRSEIETPKLSLEFCVSDEFSSGHLLLSPNIAEGLTDFLSSPCVHFKFGATDCGAERSFDSSQKVTNRYSKTFFSPKESFFFLFPFYKTNPI